MRQLVFGGTFNPIHHGHLICSRAVAEELGFERLLLLPSAQPPHKAASATLADSADRLSMARLAVASDPFITVDDLEIRRAGPSYTLDTARDLTAHGQGPVNWLIGADMLMYLPQWHRPLDLLKEVNFIIVARPGCLLDWEQLPPEYRHLQANVVKAPLISMSSTELRSRVAAGRSIRYLTPDAVCDYIQQRNLYR
jgi:nicotinate-nucleotide adenylyltransferase